MCTSVLQDLRQPPHAHVALHGIGQLDKRVPARHFHIYSMIDRRRRIRPRRSATLSARPVSNERGRASGVKFDRPQHLGALPSPPPRSGVRFEQPRNPPPFCPFTSFDLQPTLKMEVMRAVDRSGSTLGRCSARTVLVCAERCVAALSQSEIAGWAPTSYSEATTRAR